VCVWFRWQCGAIVCTIDCLSYRENGPILNHDPISGGLDGTWTLFEGVDVRGPVHHNQMKDLNPSSSSTFRYPLWKTIYASAKNAFAEGGLAQTFFHSISLSFKILP
jgi:hypothetical protein